MPEGTERTPAEQRAIEAVRAAISRRNYSPTGAAKEIGLADITLIDFMRGKKWPRAKTMARLEQWLGWPVGAINRIVDGAPVPGQGDHVSSDGQLQLPLAAADYADLSPSELSEAMTAATATFMERARSIRGSRPAPQG